jgi:hypothetical protein
VAFLKLKKNLLAYYVLWKNESDSWKRENYFNLFLYSQSDFLTNQKKEKISLIKQKKIKEIFKGRVDFWFGFLFLYDFFCFFCFAGCLFV